MKLINYDYGYINNFDCSIHGKIITTKEEWLRALKYLFHHKVKDYYLWKDLLKEDITRAIHTKKGTLFNIRVTATEKIVDKFNVKGYKRGNYMFMVV